MGKSSSQGNLNLIFIREFIVPMPPLSEQKRIVERLEKILPLINDYKKMETELEVIKNEFPNDLRASMLSDAMQGKLTEQLASDSDVEKIIEYIKEHYSKEIKESENKTSYEFPENWKCVKLVDATSLYTGNSIAESIKNTKYVGIKDNT